VNYVKDLEDLKKKVEELMERPSWVYQSVATVKSLDNFLNHLNNPELQNKKELIEEMIHAYNKTEASDFVSMQLFNDLLKKIDVKLEFNTAELKKGGEGCRFHWAMKSLQKNLGKTDENLKDIMEAVKRIPLQYRIVLEGGLYKLSIYEDDRDVLKKQITILAPFMNILSEINPEEIIAFLKPSKYISVLDMFNHIVDQVKIGNTFTLDSKEKFIQYFFPEKEVEEFKKVVSLSIVVDYFDNPLEIPEVQKILDMWDGIGNFILLVKNSLMEYANDPSSRAIIHELEQVSESLLYGSQIAIYNRGLSIASKKKDKVEVVRILKAIRIYIQKDIIDKLKIDIIPKLLKTKLSEEIFTFQEDAIKKIGIDINSLKLEKGIEIENIDEELEKYWEFHFGKEQEMLRQFEFVMKKIRKYLKKKVDEENSSKEKKGNKIQSLNKFFKNFELSWEHRPTNSELPLFNAVGAIILKKIMEVEKHYDDLIKELAEISRKSRERAVEIPIIYGLKDEEHPTSGSVRKFIKNMESVKEDLSQLKKLNEIISRISGNMRLVHMNLPYEFIKNPEFMNNLGKFLDHISIYENKIKNQKISLIMSEPSYNEKMSAISRIREIIEINHDFLKKYKDMVKLIYE